MDTLTIFYKITIMSIVSILVLFIFSKMLGKRQIAELEFMDYIIGISIGSIAAEMATDFGDKPIWVYIYAMALYTVIALMFMYISRTNPNLKHFFKGKPLTLIKNGNIDYKELSKSKLDVNDLLALLRNKDFFDIRNVECAVLENNGDLSVLPIKDYNEEDSYAFIPSYLVIDGRIVKTNLKKLNKDEIWLYRLLGISSKNELKNILLALYDTSTEEVKCYYKQ